MTTRQEVMQMIVKLTANNGADQAPQTSGEKARIERG